MPLFCEEANNSKCEYFTIKLGQKSLHQFELKSFLLPNLSHKNHF